MRGTGTRANANARGGNTTSRGNLNRGQTSIKKFTSASQNTPINTANEATKRKRIDSSLHKLGNPPPSMRSLPSGVNQLKKNTPLVKSGNLDEVVVDNNRKIESNGTKLDEILRGISNFNNRVDEIESRVNINTDNICNAGYRLNLLEQKSLNSQMEISGLDASKVSYADLKNEVTKFIIDLGISLGQEHIVDAYKNCWWLLSNRRNCHLPPRGD